jgi:hypothetical protein
MYIVRIADSKGDLNTSYVGPFSTAQLAEAWCNLADKNDTGTWPMEWRLRFDCYVESMDEPLGGPTVVTRFEEYLQA